VGLVGTAKALLASLFSAMSRLVVLRVDNRQAAVKVTFRARSLGVTGSGIVASVVNYARILERRDVRKQWTMTQKAKDKNVLRYHVLKAKYILQHQDATKTSSMHSSVKPKQ
jgi:hypothetical protein